MNTTTPATTPRLTLLRALTHICAMFAKATAALAHTLGTLLRPAGARMWEAPESTGSARPRQLAPPVATDRRPVGAEMHAMNVNVPPIVARHDRCRTNHGPKAHRSFKATIGGTAGTLIAATIPLRRLTTVASALATTLALTSVESSAQTPSALLDLGTLPGDVESSAQFVSADGTVIVGDSVDTIAGTNRRSFRWTSDSGVQPLPYAPSGFTRAVATAISADGRFAAGYLINPSGNGAACRWDLTGPTIALLVIPNTMGGNLQIARAISADGSVIIGRANFRSFRWAADTGMVPLDPNDTNSLPSSVSADGSVVAGVAFFPGITQQRAFRWTNAGGGLQNLGTLGGIDSIAAMVSQDGSTIVGSSTTLGGQTRAFRWTPTTSGGMENLQTLPGTNASNAYFVSADGSVIVGDAGIDASRRRVFRWTEIGGMTEIVNTLGGDGINSRGLSSDGKTIVGRARNTAGQFRAFRWTLATNAVQNLGTLGGIESFAQAVSADGSIVACDARTNNTNLLHGTLWGDSDGDGLRDDWERYGIPYTDADGVVQRYRLPDADPLHKDLYVEVDAMSGFALSEATISYVRGAFADSPVPNPDGTTGIRLHVYQDEEVLHVPFWEIVPGTCWPTYFMDVRQQRFGTALERLIPQQIDAKAKAFRYCIVADRTMPESIAGCGFLPGDNFVVFLGNPNFSDLGKAAIFMHELGHNLGLNHGGGDGKNGKPNYPSVMNYVLCYPYQWCREFWRLDYSRAGPFELNTLVENSLDETRGIGTPTGLYSNFFMPYGVWSFRSGNPFRTTAYTTLNGFHADFGDTAGTGFRDRLYTVGVVQDLNFAIEPADRINIPSRASPGDTLIAHNDWAAIRLALKQAGRRTSALEVYPSDELSPEAILWIDRNLPPPPRRCIADVDDGSGTGTPDGGVTVDDLLYYLVLYADGAPPADVDDGSGTGTPDAGVTIDDLLYYLFRFEAGC